MTFQFRPAVRENVPLLIGLAGASGSGKTFTAMTLAKGMAGDKRFAVIDTEAGRAKHYADQFAFDHADIQPPFRPQTYLDAITAADAAHYPVIVVDSMSHEWAGEGGILDWQDEQWAANNHAEWARMSSWIKPKLAHKAMVSKLLQVRAHVILCFRAEPKIEMIDDPEKPGKKKIVEKKGPGGFRGWLPICEKNLPYELTASFLFMAEAPGVPVPMKLQEQHRAFFPTDRPITVDAGRQLADWARGGQVNTETGEITDAPKLSTLLKDFDLKVSDLAIILGGDVSRENVQERIAAWRNDEPDLTLTDLCRMTAEEKRGGQREPQAALI